MACIFLIFMYSKEMPQHVAYFSLDLSGPIKLHLDGLLSSLGQHFQMQVPPIKHLNKRSGRVSTEHLQLLLLLMNIFTVNTQLSWRTGFNLSRCLWLGTKVGKCCFMSVICNRVPWKTFSADSGDPPAQEWAMVLWRASRSRQPVDVLLSDSQHSGLKEMGFGSLPQQGACSWPPTGASKAPGKMCRFLGLFKYHSNLKIQQINSDTSLDAFFSAEWKKLASASANTTSSDKDPVISREEFCLQIN